MQASSMPWTDEEWERRDDSRMRKIDRQNDRRPNHHSYAWWWDVAHTARMCRAQKGYRSPDGVERAAALAAVTKTTIPVAIDAMVAVFSAMEELMS